MCYILKRAHAPQHSSLLHFQECKTDAVRECKCLKRSPVCFTICSEASKTYILNSRRLHIQCSCQTPPCPTQFAASPATVWLSPPWMKNEVCVFFSHFSIRLISSVTLLIITVWLSVRPHHPEARERAQIGRHATIRGLIVHDLRRMRQSCFTWTRPEDGGCSPR